LKDISAYIRLADQQRNELKSAEKITEAGKNMISAANSDWFPTISVFGNYYYNRPNQRIMPTQDKFNDTWDVGVNLSWELWNWGKTSYKAEQAEQLYKQSQLSLEILKENIQMEVYRNYLSVNAESEKLNSALQLLESTEENYRITKEKYNMQAATSTELIDAEVEFLEAQIKEANAKADYIIALKKLLVSSGEKIY
jgi:outer membrane protein TolC